MNFFTPCLLFASMIDTVSPEVIAELWPMVLFYFVFSAISLVISVVGCRILRISAGLHRFMMVALLFSNTNSLPISLLRGIMLSSGSSVLFNGPYDTPEKAAARAVSYAVIFVIFNNVFRWTVGVRLLAADSDKLGNQDVQATKLASHNRLMVVPSSVSLAIDSSASSVNMSPSSSAYGSTASLASPRSDQFDFPGDTPALTITECTPATERDSLLPGGVTPTSETPPSRVPRGQWATFFHRAHKLWHPVSKRLRKLAKSVNGLLNPPVYAIIAALAVQFIPGVHEVVMDPDSLFIPFIKAIQISGDAAIPVMLLSLGAQLGGVQLGMAGALSRVARHLTPASFRSRMSSASSSSSNLAVPPALTLLDADVPAYASRTGANAGTSSLLVPGCRSDEVQVTTIHVPESPSNEPDALSQASSTAENSQIITSSTRGFSDGTKSIILTMVGRFIIFPAICIPMLLFLRPYIPIAAADPVFILTLMVLCCMPPAINLITVAQALGIFEEESAKLLFYTYVTAVPVLTLLITIFLLVVSNS
ncbi:hypothetical protein IWQ60_008996 [Tieghemiomyces parasiticus]|uniref:Auxin efflux carrier n=1 Tax=Tieghemiomyces parasiticus TaxID=78921 RepID=A0A9W7ZVN2_9FUNG|nr:hypothetical protein IWQ60_008996 [Tieghemiomyces parasiticus]